MSPWLTLGAALAALVWGVLPRLDGLAFSAHMLGHMLIVCGVAPSLAVAARGTRLDVGGRPLASPIVAAMVEAVVVWGWHVPALHHAARHHLWAYGLEQLSFLSAGYYLWSACFGGPERMQRAPSALAGLLLTSSHMTLLGALITLAPRALYARHAEGWWSQLHDQHLGGAVMLVVGTTTYLVAAVHLARELLADEPPQPKRGLP